MIVRAGGLGPWPLSCMWIVLVSGANAVLGQQEIGFIERFALAEDRRQALGELIPGTDEYYYYHCLHFQNERQLPEAQAILDAWRAKSGETPRTRDMLARQKLLAYTEQPQQALEFLRDELQLKLTHAAPARDRAARLPAVLDNAQLEVRRLLEQSLAGDRSLGQLEDSGLELVLDQRLAPEQLRALLDRLPRADLTGIPKLVAAELALKDSRGFGWAKLHGQLTLAQLEALLELRPQLLEDSAFIAAVSARLAPAEGTSLSDRQELRQYLNRLLEWARRLPSSQNSFKALVIGNLLRLDLSENRWDKDLFLEYLALPRSSTYYDPIRLRNFSSGASRVGLVQLDFTMQPQVPLPPMGDDSELVLRFLEHFLQSQDNVDNFAEFLDRNYLERVLAQTKILYGIGDEATWYGKLAPREQKELRERIELRFAPNNPHHFAASDSISLQVELKNVDQLIVKIYEINTLSYFRNNQQPLDTSIDLDGLVPNLEQELSFALPAQRRHATAIDLPQLTGRGVWVVDLLGAGQRSRALIEKGRLVAMQRLGDAGHVLRILDESGKTVDTAHVELRGRVYRPNDQGQIVLPYSEQDVTRNLLLVDGDFASQQTLVHRSESYRLQSGFLMDRESLVAGRLASVAINARLTCNDQPVSIRLLEQTQLEIVATDSEGIATSSFVTNLDLEDGDELVHQFLVPQRLASIRFTLSGQVANQNRDRMDAVESSELVQCNGIQQSLQIADFFVRQTPAGYRLLVLGRNGEPQPRLPVNVSVKLRPFKNRQSFTLATDERGRIELGALRQVEDVVVSAVGLQSFQFPVDDFHRHWPTVIHVGIDQTIQLPLGKAEAQPGQFSLVEVRRGVNYRLVTEGMQIGHGGLQISGLTPGDYWLADYEGHQQVRIVVGAARSEGQFTSAPSRLLEIERRAPLVIREATIVNGELRVQVAGADAMTRVHVLAHVFAPLAAGGRQLQLPHLQPQQLRIASPHSLYVNSLRLDEEYSYILDRQGHKQYPGNMLPQPSVLVNPWEISLTENQRQEAAVGDAMPKRAAPGAPEPSMAAESALADQSNRPDWKSFDFLADGTVLVANLGLTDGSLSLPMDQFAGYGSLSVLAVHPTTIDSRQIVLDDSDLQTRDLRLQKAFDADVHLAQVHKVEMLAANEKKILGDPRTRRLQAYASVADVFQLYATLLENPAWEKFRFLSEWAALPAEDQLKHYSEMACHEVDFFLFHKDRKFFDRVIRPLIAQKLDKQIVDLWLLGEPLDALAPLWKVQQLNTLERILLAERVESNRAGTRRWVHDYLDAHPLDPQWRQQRFELALRGRALSGAGGYAGDNGVDAFSFGVPLEGRLGDSISEARRGGTARSLRLQRSKAEGEGAADRLNDFFETERLGRAGLVPRFFQSLDQTREWAETQYYQVRLQNQGSELIPANPFWQQFLDNDARPFLPQDLDLPCSTLNEALCALAVIDLPLATATPKLSIEAEQLVIESETPAVLYLESIEASQTQPENLSVMVGQDFYLANPSTDEDSNRPLGEQALLRGVPYRVGVVVTNPTAEKQRVQVLTQLPAGSLPLGGSKLTRGSALELQPYSTSQVQYAFYFPAAGEFQHYGAQVSSQSDVAAVHLAATESSRRQVLDAPESVDKTTWSYIADWGTNDQVLEFLQSANLQRIELSRIAFRMKDQAFFQQVLQLLSANGLFVPELWAYAVHHNDPREIAQLLHQRPDFLARLGAAFDSPLVHVDAREKMQYEHLDYKPLVVARIHRLGRENVILNPSFARQYQALLDMLAHQRSIENDQCLQLCYYMLLQNRIEDALNWFARVRPEQLETEIQYAYFDAFLDFYRGRYDHAAKIANQFAEYPVLRWRELFSQIAQQVASRNAILDGKTSADPSGWETSSDASQRLLTDRRQNQQTQLADQTATLDLDATQGSIAIRYHNMRAVQVNYYLMDIELLFSRNPFVTRSDDSVPPIRPNLSQQVELPAEQGVHDLPLPPQTQNRNMLVEVTGQGISRSSLVTASSLDVNVVEPYGQLQVLSRAGHQPVESAYVKVFVRNRDGQTRFYKDGYTDLRGKFDYASLSTSDLDTAERFAILVLDPKLGAVVKEAKPPVR